MEFKEFPKISRLFREVVISEKLDGTNAQIFIDPVESLGHRIDTQTYEELNGRVPVLYTYSRDQFVAVWAGSRTRWISPGKQTDNYGFAHWVLNNGTELAKLGPGQHFGEYWGQGIQRGYGLKEKRFSLFNVNRWRDKHGTNAAFPGDAKQLEAPECCYVVPIISRGSLNTDYVQEDLYLLEQEGSKAAPGFMTPEGIVVFHTASGSLYKATLGDDGHKGVVAEA